MEMQRELGVRTASVRPPPSSLLRGTVSYGVFSVLAYLVALGKTVVATRYFGTSREMDAYTMAFILPMAVATLATNSCAAGLIPVLAKVERDAPDRRGKTLRGAMSVFLLVAVVIAAALAWFAEFFSRLVSPGFDPVRLQLTASMLRLLAATLPLQVLFGFGAADLLARGKYARAAFGPAIGNGIVVVAVLGFHSYGIRALALATLIGFAAQVLAFCTHDLRSGWSRWSSPIKDSYVRMALAAQLPLVVNSLYTTCNGIVDQIAAGFLPPGAVSAVGYAVALSGFVMVAIPMAIGWAVLPRFSEQLTANNLNDLKTSARSAISGGVAVAAPITAAIVLLGHGALRLIFQHGAFNEQSTRLVHAIWVGYTIALVPTVAGMVAVRIINSMRWNEILLRIGVLSIFLNAALDWLLMRWFGAAGIGVSTSVVYVVNAVILFAALRRRIGRIADSATWSLCLRAVTASLIAGGLCGILGALGISSQNLQLALQAAVLIVAISLLYAAMGVWNAFPNRLRRHLPFSNASAHA